MSKAELSSRSNSQISGKDQSSRTNSQSLKIEKLSENTTDYERSIKVILLGDSNVGKSSIIDRLKDDTFNINQRSTITLEHHNIVIKINNYTLRMQFWDTAGQEKFDSIVASYYKSAEVIILVYATNLRNSFERISEWDKKVIENGSEEEPIKILIGNKKDLEQERKVTFEEGENLAKQLGCIKFLEISCMNKENEENNKNIESIINIIGKKYYDIFGIKSDRLNSSVYNYVATDSILIADSRSRKRCGC